MAETVIAGRGMGGLSTRVSTSDERVVKLLVEAERASYGRECRRQGTSGTWWTGQKVVASVDQLLAEPAE
ncbi:MAG: hypothetical protein ACXVRS_00640 [Gaiellaceae bacterium]